MAGNQRRWERLAREPYYAVLNDPRNRGADPAARQEFFLSGERHAEWIFGAIEQHLIPDFRPRHVLDFGCGVGRVMIPFARRAERVVGVDISIAMLVEAHRNCDARGIRNVDFMSLDRFMDVPGAHGPFDLVHSFIVLQHIPPWRGYRLIDALVSSMARGGVGALHVTYARRAGVVRKAVHRVRRLVPGWSVLLNLVQRRPLFEPHMPMYQYSLRRMVGRLQRRGCSRIHLLMTDHGGHLGAVFLFQLPESEGTSVTTIPVVDPTPAPANASTA